MNVVCERMNKGDKHFIFPFPGLSFSAFTQSQKQPHKHIDFLCMCMLRQPNPLDSLTLYHTSWSSIFNGADSGVEEPVSPQSMLIPPTYTATWKHEWASPEGSALKNWGKQWDMQKLTHPSLRNLILAHRKFSRTYLNHLSKSSAIFFFFPRPLVYRMHFLPAW